MNQTFGTILEMGQVLTKVCVGWVLLLCKYGNHRHRQLLLFGVLARKTTCLLVGSFSLYLDVLVSGCVLSMMSNWRESWLGTYFEVAVSCLVRVT
jgi:hypothetical protein